MNRATEPTRTVFRKPSGVNRSRRRRVAAGVAIMALASGVFLAAAPAAAVPAAGDDQIAGLNYVALGDSYSAGYGLTPYNKTYPAPGCYQADENYPHQVATALDLKLTDVTCSNAVTANIIDTPQETGSGTAPVQSKSLSTDTDIVTVTIGGNDIWFAIVAATCLAAHADGPLLLEPWADDCESLYNYTIGGKPVDILLDQLHDVVTPALAKTYQVIHQKAPNAKVFVVGYPAIAPDDTNTPPEKCFTSLIDTESDFPFRQNAYPFTNVDVPYLHKIEGALNDAIQQQAELAGATFIPTFAQTESKTPCASNPESYINGITVDIDGPFIPPTIPEDLPPVTDDGHFTDKSIPSIKRFLQAGGASSGTGYGAVPGVALGALHPNVTGVTFLRDQVIAAIRASFAGTGDNGAGGSGTGTAGTAEPAGSSAETLAATGSDAGGWLGLSAFLLAAGAVLVAVRRRRSATR